LPIGAAIVKRAAIAVVAGSRECIVGAAIGATQVFGARVAIVAIQGRSSNALAGHALVPSGADETVIARAVCGDETAPGVWLAAVRRAWIGIVARQRSRRSTEAVHAAVSEGAGVAVTAGVALVGWYPGALAGFGGAVGRQAKGMGVSRWRGAGDGGVRDNLTLVWNGLRVAIENAIA
jgi:hypothetical protein